MKSLNSYSFKFQVSTGRLIIILLIFFITSLSLVIHFINTPIPNDADDKLRIEIVKSLLGILTIAVAGGIVAALFKAHEKYMEQSRIRVQASLTFINRLGELYRSVKAIRRVCNSAGIETRDGFEIVTMNENSLKLYYKKMSKLEDIQLEIEGFKTAAEHSVLFDANLDAIAGLRSMEQYLRKILKEFEANYLRLSKLESCNLFDLPYFQEFTHANAKNTLLTDKRGFEGGNYCFKHTFADAYYITLGSLSKT